MLNTFGRRAVAAVTATMIMTGTALGGTVISNAQEELAPINAKTLSHIVDGSQTASLTIHKYKGNPTGDVEDNTSATAEALRGNDSLKAMQATFKVYKLNLDPRNFDDWQTYSKLNPLTANADESAVTFDGVVNADGGTVTSTKVDTVTTSASDGVGTLENADLGFYYVREVSAVDPDGGNGAVNKVSPFLVSLPSTTVTNGVTGTEWNYDIHVYPKNQFVGIEKTVEDASVYAVGDKLNYTINADVPRPAQGGDRTINTFSVIDTQPENVTINKDSVSAKFTFTYTNPDDFAAIKDSIFPPDGPDGDADPMFFENQDGVDSEGTNTFQNDDMTITTEGGVTITLKDSNTVTVEFPNDSGFFNVRAGDGKNTIFELNENGLFFVSGFMDFNSATGKATYTYDATINAITNFGEDGKSANTQTNKAYLISDTDANSGYKKTPNTPPKDAPSSETSSKFGQISITKVNADGTEKLSKAEFELHRCEPGKEGDKEGVLVKDSAPISVYGKTKFISNYDGVVNIRGVRLEDYYNGSEKSEDLFDYCLVETKAPEGYELRPNPILTSITVSNPVIEAASFEVSNVEHDSSVSIPRTGEAGMGIIAAIGLFLAGLFGFKATRKNKSAA